MRSLGGSTPLRPKAEAGINVGIAIAAPAAEAAPRRNRRRLIDGVCFIFSEIGENSKRFKWLCEPLLDAETLSNWKLFIAPRSSRRFPGPAAPRVAHNQFSFFIRFAWAG
jgi:hypothetical protein